MEGGGETATHLLDLRPIFRTVIDHVFLNDCERALVFPWMRVQCKWKTCFI